MKLSSFIIFDGEELKINESEFLLYPEFRKLLSKELNGSKDLGVDNKKYIKDILIYIYITCDNNSQCLIKGLTKQETHKYAIEKLGSSYSAFKPNQVVKDCMDLYKYESNDVILEGRNELLATFNMYPEIIRQLRKELKEKIKTVTTENVPSILKSLSELNKISTDYPTMLLNIKNAFISLEKMTEESQDRKQMRGGTSIINSADPNNQYAQ